MWYQVWIPILIPALIIKSNCDENNNKTDTVFVRYGGHADVTSQYRVTTATQTTERTTTTVVTTTTKKREETTTAEFYEEATEDVVFIPNEAPPVSRDEEYGGRGLRLKDIMKLKTVDDALNKDFHVEKAAEEPNEDIVFITGKNHDGEKAKPEEKTRRRYSYNNDYNENEEEIEDEVTKIPPLNCNNLDCDNTINSVCGAKLINNELRYRLFLNDCFFRKVNCGFKYEINRYKKVKLDECKKIGAHHSERPFPYKPKPYIYKPEVKLEPDNRRSLSSRRSMTKNINGELCSHPCPVTCPEDYDPQCAMSDTGERHVFVNHCKMDLNSCSYSIAWHKRPLSECVGGKKADMRQNRGFIGWMQRVGIVDRKGRLVLE